MFYNKVMKLQGIFYHTKWWGIFPVALQFTPPLLALYPITFCPFCLSKMALAYEKGQNCRHMHCDTVNACTVHVQTSLLNKIQNCL